MSSALQIQFLGIEEGSDPKNLPPGTLLRAENCAMDKTRRLCKRDGTVGLVKTALAGSNIAAGTRLISSGKDTSLTDGATAWTYDDTLAKWGRTDRPACWRVTRRALSDSTRSVATIDSVVYGTWLISLAVMSGTRYPFYRVADLATGAVIVPDTLLGVTVCGCPRLLVSGTKAYFLVSAVGTIEQWVFDLATLATPVNTGSLVTNSVATPGVFDAVIGTPTAGVPTLYVAYELAAGTDRTRIASFTVSTLAGVATASYLGTDLTAIGLAFGTASQRVLLCYAATTSGPTRLVTATTALAAVHGPTTIFAPIANYVFIAEDDATNALVGWSYTRPSVGEEFSTGLHSIAAGVVVAATMRTTYQLASPSKPWRVSSRWYCLAVAFAHHMPSGTGLLAPTASSVVVEIETTASFVGLSTGPHTHAATLENQTGWAPQFAGYVVKPTVDSAGNVYIPAAYRNREPSHWYSTIPIGWNVYRLAASEGDTARPAALGAGALCAAGAPFWLDGATARPYGFPHAPCILAITPSNTGPGALPALGVFSYVATYAWRDANGVIHRSTPSPPFAATALAGAEDTLTVRVETMSLAGRQGAFTSAQSANPVFIELWRTTNGGTGNHYRLSLEPTDQVATNDTQVAFIDVVDTKADTQIGSGSTLAVLSAMAQLYTDIGELANVPPPSFITITTHRGRFAGIGPDLRTLWFSKDATQDATLAPGFNEALTLAFGQDKTALASLDTVLVVFGEDDIDVVNGEGPDDAGNNNTWQIQSVHTDVGCINPRSPVVFPGGVIFESRVGLSLIDRALVVSWIGRSIDDTLALYPNITSGVLVAEQTEVRWTCDDGEFGIVLAYDYLEKIWFVRKYSDSVRFVDAALINGVYTLLTAAGQVYRETTAHKLDNGADYVERDILLAPISAQPGRSGWSNDNLGWSRVKDLTCMGTSVTDHDLEVSFAHDYATTFSQTKTFVAGDDVTTPGPLEKSRVTCARQKCQAVQIRIRDLTPTAYAVGTGDGPIFESLSLRVAAIDGNARTGEGQRG